MAKISDVLATGVGGILPMLMAKEYKSNAAADKASAAEEEAAVRAGGNRAMKGAGMKKGGVTRADGCITKGHTRGKMV